MLLLLLSLTCYEKAEQNENQRTLNQFGVKREKK